MPLKVAEGHHFWSYRGVVGHSIGVNPKLTTAKFNVRELQTPLLFSAKSISINRLGVAPFHSVRKDGQTNL